MNVCFISFLIIAMPLIGEAQSTKDPFAAVEKISVDRSSDKKSDQFLESELLRAFEEPRLDKGTGRGLPLIRITVLRSFHAPLMFKWYPADPGEESRLEVKRLKQVIDINGKRSFLGLDLYQNLKLRPSRELILKEIHQHF